MKEQKSNFWADRVIDQECTWDRDFSKKSTRTVENDESWWYDEK